jgi:tetratricopeptide (TPR) repeat protein
VATVFVSYRSVDGTMAAATVAGELGRLLGPEKVFWDAHLQPGERYPDALRGELERAAALVAVIGTHWLDRDAGGTRMVDRPGDWVRCEIRWAIERRIPVVPVLIGDARLPTTDELPDDIKELALRQAIRLTGREPPLARMPALARRLQDEAPVLRAPGPALRALLAAQRVTAEQLPYRLLSGPQPPLSEVYVEQVAQPGPAPAGDTKEDKPSRAEYTRTALPVAELLSAERHVVLLGEPGAGKSVLLRHLVGRSAARWARPEPAGDTVAVRVPATALVGRPLGEALAAAVNADLGSHLDQPVPAELFAEQPILDVDWLVLVDGLDEILDAGQRAATVRALADRMARQGSGFRFVVATRPLPEPELVPLAGVGTWRLRPFDDTELATFARRWFAAQQPGTAEEAAARFLAEVHRRRLQAIVRLPLLATIAAVVFEQHRDGRLPAAHAALYDDFVRYLLQVRQETLHAARELRSRLSVYTGHGTALADRLLDLLPDLLAYLADRSLAGDGDLWRLATGWTAQHCPDLPRLVPDWDVRLLDLLRSTGLLLERDGTPQFLHQSFAEYLAAGIEEDPGTWRQHLLDANTRNRALFTAARWDAADLAARVRPLLRVADTEQLQAVAAILAYGMRLPVDLEAETVHALLRDARASMLTRRSCEALAALPGRPSVVDGLAELMNDHDALPGCRVAAALAYLGVGETEAALTTLREVATESTVEPQEQVRAAQALGEHGDQPAAQAILAAICADDGVPAEARVEAADAMTVVGDTPELAGMLRRLATDSAVLDGVRVQAASSLAAHGDADTAIRVLAALTDDPRTDAWDRITAAAALGRLDRRDHAVRALLTILYDRRISVHRRAGAAEKLAVLDQRAAVTAVTRMAEEPEISPFALSRLARSLIALAEPAAALAVCRRITAGRWMPEFDGPYVIEVYAAAGDRDSAIRMANRLSRWYRRGPSQRSAAHALVAIGERERARAVLRHLLGPFRNPSSRSDAAQLLAGLGDTTRARQTFRRVLMARRATTFTRSLAASQLASLGERSLALAYLERVATRRRTRREDRARAASTLAGLGRRDQAHAVLLEVLRGRRDHATCIAAKGLAGIGATAAAIAAMEAMAHDRECADNRRLWAVRELVELGRRDSAARAAAEVLHDLSAVPQVRLDAARLLEELGGTASEITLLSSMVTDRRVRTGHRREAARLLRRRAAGRDVLREIAAGPAVGTRLIALLALGPALLSRRSPR